MRKVLLGLVAASLLALGSAGSTASADNQGADWLAAGTGTLICCNQPMVHVNAQSGVGGVNARGHFWIRYPNGGPEFGGLIRCLNVVGNSAGLTGEIETVKTGGKLGGVEIVTGDFIPIRITDNGSPGTADLVNFDRPMESKPASCAGLGDLPISQGNYVVHAKPVTDPLGLDQLTAFLAQIEQQANDPYG